MSKTIDIRYTSHKHSYIVYLINCLIVVIGYCYFHKNFYGKYYFEISSIYDQKVYIYIIDNSLKQPCLKIFYIIP